MYLEDAEEHGPGVEIDVAVDLAPGLMGPHHGPPLGSGSTSECMSGRASEPRSLSYQTCPVTAGTREGGFPVDGYRLSTVEKSGVSASFLPEKTNRLRITREKMNRHRITGTGLPEGKPSFCAQLVATGFLRGT